MAVRVARGVKSRLTEEFAGAITLQVQQADDAQAAWRGLEAAVSYLSRFDADRWAPEAPDAAEPNTPNYVSDPMPAATGPFIFVDAKSWPEKALGRLPELLAEQLQAAGLDEGLIVVPDQGGPLTDAFVEDKQQPGLARAVAAVLLTPVHGMWGSAPRGEIPDAWLQLASQWLAGHPEGPQRVRVAVVSLEFELDLADVPAFLSHARAVGTQVCRLVVGELEGRIRAVNLRAGSVVPNVALGAGGPAAGDDDLLAAYHELVAALRGVAGQLGYGFASFDPDFNGLYGHLIETEWTTSVGPPGSGGTMRLFGEMVADGFPYQVLGPGHLERLGSLWQSGLGTELDGGRMEVEIGEPAQWLLPADVHLAGRPGGPRGGAWNGLTGKRRDPQAQLAARGLLAPCLLTNNEARLLLSRYRGKL